AAKTTADAAAPNHLPIGLPLVDERSFRSGTTEKRVSGPLPLTSEGPQRALSRPVKWTFRHKRSVTAGAVFGFGFRTGMSLPMLGRFSGKGRHQAFRYLEATRSWPGAGGVPRKKGPAMRI